ncbi:glutamine--fructose-6-phosphate transaminase (isomerizing) [Candidatus Woesearchaeota archaeon]|nr:glutamine--fructose-6-phosphate transaminase (isomerizing) [Candidatus Woesearchaeota archaeon]
MCGIAGYLGKRKASPILLDAVRRLEYRGYDSVGIATLHEQRLSVRKAVGNVEEVDKKLHFAEMPGNVGIAHTRWATTGKVTDENAHPHLSNNGKIAVVHNGIIENYQELKGFLQKNGYTLKSQTDTEVIPNLIEHHMKRKSLKQAFLETLRQLEGTFSIVALDEGSGTILGARHNSPLVLGLARDGTYIASDVSPFIEATKKAVLLEDDEAVILDNKLEILNFRTGKPVRKKIFLMHWNYEQAKKGDYEHFMMKEIDEQGSTIKKAVQQDAKLMKKAVSMVKKAFGVFLVGCGTSYHACVSASYVFSHIAKKHVNVVLASEFENHREFLTNKTLLIALSQSGETADVLEAVRIAKDKGVKIIAITNVVSSTLTQLADETIMMNCGPEICVLSTKSYTAQLAILTALVYGLAGKLEAGKKLVLQAAAKVPDIIRDSTPKIKALASKIKDSRSIFLIGRDMAYPSALEGALKIKEVSYIHAEGFAGGELKHGTIALIEDNVPVIVLATEHTKKEILANAMEVKARGGYIIGINSRQDDVYDYFIEVPEAGMANPILMIIPIQILAYYLAIERNLDPDKPRNLAKSVTVK